MYNGSSSISMENEMIINSPGSSIVRDRLLSSGKSFNVVTTCDLIIKNNTQKYRESVHTDIVNSVRHFPRMLGDAIHDSQVRRARTTIFYEIFMPLLSKWILKLKKCPPPHIRMIFEKPVLSKYAPTLKQLRAFLRSNQRVSLFHSSKNLYKKLHAGVSKETSELSSLRKEPSVSIPKSSPSSLPAPSDCNVLKGEERTQMKDCQGNTKSIPSGLMVSKLKGYGSELLRSVDSTTPTHEFEKMSGFSSLCKKAQPDKDLEKRLLSRLQQYQSVLVGTAGNLAEQLCKRQGNTSKKVRNNALFLACPPPPPGTPSCSNSREGRKGSSRFAGSVEGVLYFENFVPKRNPNSAMPNTLFIEFKMPSPES